MKNSENGRSMIEMMGVLAVIGVLSTAGISGYIKMMAQYKINKAVEQIEQISAKLSAIGSSVESYEGLNNKSAVKSDAVPSEAIIGDGTNLENPFGGEISIAASGLIEDGDNLAYNIIYKGLSEDACVALGSYDWNRNKNSNLVGVGVATAAKLGIRKNRIIQNCGKKYPCCTVTEGGYAYANLRGTCETKPKQDYDWDPPLPMPLAAVAKACSKCDENPDDPCAIVLKYF